MNYLVFELRSDKKVLSKFLENAKFSEAEPYFDDFKKYSVMAFGGKPADLDLKLGDELPLGYDPGDEM